MTKEQVDYLLALPKKVETNDVLEDAIVLTQTVPFNLRYKLVSPEDDEFTFLYDVDQSAKNYLKLSLHFMDNDSKVGLLRIDFCGQHQNPENINQELPAELYPFAGKLFSYNEPHLHLYVDGYKPLAWAVPLRWHPAALFLPLFKNLCPKRMMMLNCLKNLWCVHHP